MWSARGVRAWHEGWWEVGRETGNLLAPILGVPKNTISMHQNVTVAQGIIASCFTYGGPRRKIVMTELEFPSNHYLFEGFRRYGAEVVYVPSSDPIRLDLERFLDAIDERTLLVPLSLVLFKSACITDARAVIEKAHRVGAHVILDVYQAAGTVPMDLEALARRLRRRRLGEVAVRRAGGGLSLRPARSGGHARARARRLGGARRAVRVRDRPVRYAAAPERFQSGTPNVPSLYSARAGYEIVASIGVPAIRERSLQLTRRLIDAARADGYRLNTPDRDHERGGSVIIDVPNGAGGRRRADPPRGHRRLPPRRRHPHGAALLQHRGGDRPRDGDAARDRGTSA